MIRNITLCILFFSFQFSFSQEKIDELIKAFDTNNIELKLKLIDEFENNPKELDKLNDVNFNLFKLIKFESIGYTDNQYVTTVYADYFKDSFDYFLENNLITDLLPFFLNKYAVIYMSIDLPKAKQYLEKAIEIEENNRNKSIYPSVFNIYHSLQRLELVDFENKNKYTKARFELFKENKETIEPFVITGGTINSLITLFRDANFDGLFNIYKEKDLANYILDLSIDNIDKVVNYSEIGFLLEMATMVKRKEGLNILSVKFSEILSQIEDKNSIDYYVSIIAGYKYYQFIGRLELAHAMVLEVMTHKIYKDSKPIFNEDASEFSLDPSVYWKNFSEINDILNFDFNIIQDFLQIAFLHYGSSPSKEESERLYFWVDYVLDQNNFFYENEAISETDYNYHKRLFSFTKFNLLFSDNMFREILDLEFDEDFDDATNIWKYAILRGNSIAKFKTGQINYLDFSSELKSLRNDFNFKLDAVDFVYLKADPMIIEARVNEIKEVLTNVSFINSLSYDSQIKQIDNMYSKFTLLIGDLLKYEFYDNEFLSDIFEILLDIDNIDKYNSRLLNLDEKESNKYFELLSQRRTISPYSPLEFNQMIFEFDSFQKEMKSKFINKPRVSLKNFQNKLNDNEAYIRIYKLMGWTKNDLDNYIGFIYLKDDLIFVKFDDIEYEKIRDFYTSSVINEIKDEVSYKYLFKPIREKLPKNISKIYIKNDGIFNNVNLEAIYLKDNQEYVINEYDIEYVETPNSIFSNTVFDFNTAFLFGNPLFRKNQESNGVRSRISQLPNTKIEIDEINDLLINSGIKSIKTDGIESNEKNLYANSNRDIIHIATHGFYNDKSIVEGRTNRFNYGLLASNYDEDVLKGNADNYSIDGVIFGGEILYKNFTNNDLLILSACETGVGESYSLGTENLSNAFLRAGSKNIISTLWPVDDQITKDFMVEFYRNLIISNNIYQALSKTKEKFKQTYTHPKYWGAFVLLSNSI